MTEASHTVFDRVNPRLLDSEALQRCTLGECHGACCVFGVWVDLRERDDILHHSALISPYMPEHSPSPVDWFAGVEDIDPFSPSGKVVHTAVENRPDHYGKTACVFCCTDGRCALQIAALENSMHPWRFKPFYCILHPLDLDDSGRITLDAAKELKDEEGSCLRPADESIPLFSTFETELRYLLGEKTYDTLRELASKRYHKPFE